MKSHVTVTLDPVKLVKFDAWWKAEGIFKSRSDAVEYLMTQVKYSKPPEPSDY